MFTRIFALAVLLGSQAASAARLWFGVPPQNLDFLEDVALSLSDPQHPFFDVAEPLSSEDILSITAPEAHAEIVRQYAVHVGATNCDVSLRDWVRCDYPDNKCPAKNASVTDIIVAEAPRAGFPARAGKTRSGEETPTDTYYIVPRTTSAQYDFPITGGGGPVGVGAAEFLRDQSISFDDASAFAEATGTDLPDGWPPIVRGHWDNSSADTEASLDYDILLGNVPRNAQMWYWGADEWMLLWASRVFHSSEIPEVLSISWGWNEMDQCGIDGPVCAPGTTSREYVHRANTEFMKLAARGLTLVASAGDAGAPGRTDEGCNNNPVLNPAFPASSPWVVAVGSTQFETDPPLANASATDAPWAIGGHVGEKNCDLSTGCGYTSGSGFSDLNAPGSWVGETVSGYLSDPRAYKPESFNRSGRAYPDVTALGSIHYYTVVNNQTMAVGGTSASAPLVAAMLSHVVSALGRPLGAGNPFLYRMAADCEACFARQNLPLGWSNCTEEDCCATGYGSGSNVTWDPVYGLGLPRVSAWIDYAVTSGQN